MRLRVPCMRLGSATTALLRLLENNHALTAVLLLCVMAGLVAIKTHDTASRVRQNFDLESVITAGDLLAEYRRASDETAPSRSHRLASAPGYALILFGMALADPAVGAAIECRANDQPCDDSASFRSVIVLQFALAVLSLILVFALALRLSASHETAMLTLVLAFMVSRLGDFAGVARPLIWPPVLTYLFFFLAIEAHARRNPLFALGSGLAAGANILFAPLVMVAMAAVALLLAIVPHAGGRSFWIGVANAIGILAGSAVAGWLFLLAVSLSYDPAASVRLIAAQLSERVAFQAMDLAAWLASLILPIPLVGGLAKPLVPEATIHRLGYYVAGTYIMSAYTDILPRALAQSSSPLGQLAWLIKTHVFGSLASYLAVTPSILNRGLWGGADVVGLVGVFHLKRMVVFHRLDGRLEPLLVLAAPVGLQLLASTLLTANHYWYNPALVFLYSYAMAYVVARFPRD